MRILSIFASAAFCLVQEPTIEQLVELLRSGGVEERNEAERKLLRRDDDPRPALERAARDPDPELSARARELLDLVGQIRTLTPALKAAIPDARDRIASRKPHAWTELLLEATEQQGTRRRHPGLGREDFMPLACRAARGADRSEAGALCAAIAAWDLTPAAPELVRWLDEPDWEIRRFAIDAIVTCRDPAVVPMLLDRCRQNLGGLWSTWVGMLARMGCREVVPEIASAMLAQDQNRRVTQELYATFPDLDALEVVPALLRLVRAHEAHEAIPALELLAPDEILPALFENLSSDDEGVRTSTLWMMATQHATSAALHKFREFLGKPGTRNVALTAIGNLRRKDLLPEVRGYLEDPSPYVRRTAASILASFGDRGGLPELVLALRHPDARRQAMGALRVLGAREAIPDLLPLLRDPEVRFDAMDVLAVLQAADVREFVLRSLKDPAPEARRYAAVALTNLDKAAAIPLLLPMLDDPDPNAQSTAAQMLNHLRSKEAGAKYREWLRSDDPSRRSTAAWALGSSSPSDAAAALVAMLDDEAMYNRATAAEMLGRFRRVEAAPKIRVLLHDRDPHVRRSAATALVWLGDASGVPDLLRDSSDQGNRFELNVLRRPEVCLAWREKILSGPSMTASNREVLEEVCRRAGIALEIPPEIPWPVYTNYHEIEGGNFLTTVWGLLWRTGGAVVEEGRLRVLTPREGRRFWRRWWAEQDSKEGPRMLAALEESDHRLAAWKTERATAAATPDELRALLTPFLRGVPGLEDRLVTGKNEEWTHAFLEASQGGREKYRDVTAADLDALAPRALRGAISSQELCSVLQTGAYRRLRTLRPLAEDYLRDRDPGVRVSAAQLLLTLEGSNALPRTLPLLDDPDARARQGYVAVLGGLGLVEAAPEVLSRKSDPAVQTALIGAASGLQVEEMLPLLLSKAKRTPGGNDDYGTRISVGFEINALGNPSLGREICDCLKTEDHPNAVYGLLNMLGQWGCRDAIPDLLELLKQPKRMSELYDSSLYRALTLLGAREAGPLLIGRLKPGRSLAYAADALAQLGLKDAIPPLRLLLASNDARSIAASAGALAALDDRESIPRLRSLLGHEDLDVRGAASAALVTLGDRESFPQIVKMASTSRRSDSMREALILLRAPEACALLAASPSYPTSRSLAALASGGAAVLPALREQLDHRDLWTRHGAVRALGCIDVDGVLPDLRRMLQDEAPDVAQMAAAMLCRRGFREGVPQVWERARKKFSALPFDLNGVRAPGTWRRLQTSKMTTPYYGTAKQLLEKVAAAAGLPLEGLPETSREYPAWANVHLRVLPAELPLSGIEVIERTSQVRWMVVLEADRIRILPRKESLAWWGEWVARENR